MNKKTVIWTSMFAVFFMFALLVSAANETSNSTMNITINTTLADTFNTELQINTTVDTTMNVTNDTESVIENSTLLNSSDENVSFIFDVLLESAEFIQQKNKTMINVSGRIATMLDSNVSIYSAVEMDAYTYDDPARTNNTDFNVCAYYVNGTLDFSCSITNGSYFTLITMTEFENETLYRYAEFDYDTVLTELMNRSSEQSIQNETHSTGNDTENFNVQFKEIYTNGSITGTIFLNTSLENNSVRVEVWPINSTNSSYADVQSCTFEMNTSLNFTCPVSFMESGTYQINVTVEAEQTYREMEITYFKAPEFVLRTEHEGVYTIGDIVTIDAYGLLNNKQVDSDIVLTVEAGNYTLNSTTGVLEFVALNEGTYDVSATAVFRGKNYSRNSTIVITPSIATLTPRKERIDIALNNVYERGKEIRIPMNISNTQSDAVTTYIINPDNSSFEYISKIKNGRSEIAFLPEDAGEYAFDMNINNTDTGLFKAITVLNTTEYVEEQVLNPVINRTQNGRPIKVQNVFFDNTTEEYDVLFNVSTTSRANLHGIKTLDTITYVQSPEVNDSTLSTDIFAIDTVNVTSAELTLTKTKDVEYILHCLDWNATNATCADWTKTSIPFIENETHITFNVTHFTAYAGGGGNNSELWIWDTADTDKENIVPTINTLVNFTANYTDNATGTSIATAACTIEFNNDTTVKTMAYDNAIGKYWYNRSFATNGLNKYQINCSDFSYDDLTATDNVSIFSSANVSEVQQTRENVTVGYSSAISCRVVDGYNATPLYQYNVSYYSSVEGYLGSQTTDALGWSSVIFEPAVNGTHTITCNITDDSEQAYLASAQNEQVLTVNAAYSKLTTERNMIYNSSQTFNVSLTIKNDGLYRLDDVTVADFVPEGFVPVYPTVASDWNETTILNVPGTLFFWNLSLIPGQSMTTINYTLIPLENASIYDISKSYIVGETYHVH